jgi:hypothetical protein
MLAKITAVYSLYGEVASMKWKNEMVKEYNGKDACSAIYSMKPSRGNLKDPGQSA